MKKLLLASVAIMMIVGLATLGFAFEVGGQAVDLEGGTTYVTKYMFRGVDTFGDGDGGIQPYATLTVHPFDANLAAGFWGSYALTDGHENLDEQDYWFSLDKDFLDGLLNVGTGYTYYDYFNASTIGDINEWFWSIGLSEIPLPGEVDLPGLGPTDAIPVSLGYMMAYAWGNVNAATAGGIDNGWYHEITAGIEVPLPGTEKVPGQEDGGMTLAWDNTLGIYDGSLGFDEGLAYWKQSWGTSFALPLNMALSPSLNYQVSNKSKGVNTDDEFWFELDLSMAV